MTKYNEIYDKDSNESEGWAVYPEAADRSSYEISPDSHLVIPDLNANYVFLIHCLLRHDIIQIKSGNILFQGKRYQCDEKIQFDMLCRIQSEEQTNFNLMKDPQNLNPLFFNKKGFINSRYIYELNDFNTIFGMIDKQEGKTLGTLFEANLDTIQAIFQNITLKEGKIKGLKLIGDELCDRLGDDIKVLFLLDRLDFLCKAKNVDLSFVFSNHTLNFFQKYLYTKAQMLKSNQQYCSYGYWNVNRQMMGKSTQEFFTTQYSYLLMCFQLAMIGTFNKPTYTNFLENTIDKIVRTSYVPNISIMELYNDTHKRKILISHAPVRWTNQDDSSVLEEKDITLFGFLSEYNKFAVSFNREIEKLSPMEQANKKLFPEIDLSNNLQGIICNLNRVFRDYELLEQLVDRFIYLERFVFDRGLQASPFPEEIINLFGHNGVLTKDHDFYCCIDSFFSKFSNMTFLRSFEEPKRNLRVAFLRLQNDSLDVTLKTESKNPSNPLSLGISPKKEIPKRKIDENPGYEANKLFKAAKDDRESQKQPSSSSSHVKSNK